MTISVIMSTYHREEPQYLDSALKSIWTDQVRKPDQIVLVKDGPLPAELDSVINKWKNIVGECFCVISNKENKGLALSLNDAIEVSTGDLLARMDSDDISCPERFLLQEKYMTEHPEVDILGGALREFNNDNTLDNIRRYPASHKDVLACMHRMSPLGHPSVMFRRRFFDEGFRYSNKYHICEDVTMWYDAVAAGKIINNMPTIILNFRRNDSTITRRSREKAWSEFCAYNDGIHKVFGLCTTRYIYSVMRLLFRLMPIFIIKGIYKGGYLRNKMSNN